MNKKMEFEIGQMVDLKRWGSGKITKLHKCKESGKIMCVDVAVKPRTQIDVFFTKDGFCEERTSYSEVEWNGSIWVLTKTGIENRLWSEKHGGA